jgi:hypothetical protein
MADDLDERDQALLAARAAARAQLTGPLVGDFVVMPDGTMRRFTHAWPIGLQTTVDRGKGHYDARFYISRDGHADFSGSLDPIIPARAHRAAA